MPDVTFTYTAAELNRMKAAVGRETSLGRDATNAETKAFWALQQKVFVHQSEKKEATRAYEASLTDTPFEPS